MDTSGDSDSAGGIALDKTQKKFRAAFAALISRLPKWLQGIKGTCRFFSSLGVAVIALAVFFAARGHIIWAVIFALFTALIFILSNFWLSVHVVDPILGLGETARRIADGSFGTLAEERGNDEIGALTDAINDMSARICASNKLQAEFISSVSHELRTPLTAITGWSETLLYDEAIQGDSRRGVDIISKESGRLTHMVEELLEFSRIRDGRFTLNIETMDICAEVEDAVFTYEKLLRHEGMELIYDPPEADIPAVAGDPRRLKQVIVNILDNAAKYGRGGDVELTVGQDGGFVIIRIRDHGPGIPQKDLPHVKEKFYKGGSRERGSGIGLSICDEIVARHGGALTVANAEGGGTVVTISLPIQTQK